MWPELPIGCRKGPSEVGSDLGRGRGKPCIGTTGPRLCRRSVRSMANGFDVVPVRVEDKRGVVVGMVVRTDAGGAVIPSPGCERRFPETMHTLPGSASKRDMNRRFRARSLVDPKGRIALHIR